MVLREVRGRTDGSVTISGTWRLTALLLALWPVALVGQSVRGRVLDGSRRPLIGALVELRDPAGQSLKIVLTTASGAFQFDAPAAGRYLYRVAAIGFQPQPLGPIDVPAVGLVLPDIVLRGMTMRLPDIVALGRGRFCGKSGLADQMFEQLLESAHTALQVMEAAVNDKAIGFQVGIINTKTIYGPYNNFAVADTIVQKLSAWPVLSIDPDTLRAVGFGRMREAGNEGTREYYGPDARVLFADWFLESHCFTLDKPRDKKVAPDSLHLRFAPARKGKLVDVAGELVLDAHNLALLQFSFVLRNLPNWMPDEAAGGYMEFSSLNSGMWMTKSWAIWAPLGGVNAERRMSVAGQAETYGFVTKVYTGRDSTVISWPKKADH